MDFLKKFPVKTTLILLGVVFLLAMVYVGIRYHRSQLNDAYAYASDFESQLKKERDQSGQLHVQVQSQEVTLQTLKNLNTEELRLLRHEVGNLKNFVSQIKGSISITDSIRTSLRDSVVYSTLDSSKTVVRTFNYADNWSRINGVVFPESLSVNYRFQSNFTSTTFWKREKWYKPKSLVVTLITDNPHLDVSSLSSLNVKQPQKKWYETRAFAFGMGFVLGTGSTLYMQK